MYQTVSQTLPSFGTGLSHYLAEIRKFPILTQEEETSFWPDAGDAKAIARQPIAS